MKRLTILAVAVTTLAITPIGSAHANTTTIQVKGGDFYFKLSTKTIAKPGKVTFVFKSVGHVIHDFKIAGKTTRLIPPGTTTRLVVTLQEERPLPLLLHRARTCR